MEDQKITVKQALFLIAIAVGLSFLIAYVDRDQPAPKMETMIPAPPDNSGDWYYSFHDHSWRKIFRGTPRANDSNSSSRARKTEEVDIQEYLEKHVDGYLEDTYWGEEYDISDKED